MKKILCLICFLFLLNGCFNPKKLYTKSLNKDWKIGGWYNAIDGSYNISAYENREIQYMYVYISDFGARKKLENCYNSFELNFKIYSNSKNEVVEYLEKNQITFDTSKSYIIKDGKKYKVKLDIPNKEQKKLIDDGVLLTNPLYKDYWNNIDDSDYKMNVSGTFLTKIGSAVYRSGYESQVNSSIGHRFIAPFGCAALEGTILVIDGLYLNDKKLDPIEIKLSYEKPR